MKNENPSSLPLQALWLCGSKAGKHNGQRQPPLCRAGARAAGHRHRQLCLQDDRLAKTMRGWRQPALARSPPPLLQLLWLLFGYFLFSAVACFFLVFVHHVRFCFCFLHNVLYQKRACALYSAKRGCSRMHVIIFFFPPVSFRFSCGRNPEWIRGSAGWGCGCVCVWQSSGVGEQLHLLGRVLRTGRKSQVVAKLARDWKSYRAFLLVNQRHFVSFFLKQSGLRVRGLKYYFASHLNMAA